MDAAIMDGATLDVGAVAAIRCVRHPVSVARLLLAEKPVLLVGEGAQAFAAARGVEIHNVTAADRSGCDHDTVGCVAQDRHGNLAVATSTGGLAGQMRGRVGDAPIPGCGFYADNSVGAVALSGDGESIMRTLLAARVMEMLERRASPVAVADAMRQLDRVGGEAGIIAIDASGRFGITHNSEHFAVALAASWLPGILAGVHQDEFEGYDLHG
jgi:beta-aspartyl-peptidase (threonine type)